MGARRGPLGSMEVQRQDKVVNASVVSERECIP
jgi:hypothetical protein